MVGGVDRMAAGHGGTREAVVAAGMLGGAVDDLEHGPGRAAGQPAGVVDQRAIGGGKLLSVHGHRRIVQAVPPRPVRRSAAGP
jgi:hypothetical protein